jgi:hypothetical protein
MIYKNLARYEELGISDEMIMVAFQHCRDPLLIEVTNHVLNATLAEGRPERPGRHHWFIALFERLAPFLGDIKLVINMQVRFMGGPAVVAGFFDTTLVVQYSYFWLWVSSMRLQDEPCSWTAPLPPDAEAAYQRGELAFKDAWLAHGCNGAGMERVQNQHGFFVAPTHYPNTREVTPVWSIYSMTSCFGGERPQCDHPQCE